MVTKNLLPQYGQQVIFILRAVFLPVDGAQKAGGKKCQGCAAACYAGNNVADEAGNGNDRCIRNLGRDMLHVVAACTGR